MRRRVLAGMSIGSVAVVVLVALVGPWALEDELVQKASKVISKSIGSEVTVGGSSVGFWRHFPRVDVRLEDVHVAGSAPFASEDFLTANGIRVAFDLIDVVQGDYTARAVHLEQPVIRAVSGAGDTSNFAFGGPNDASPSDSADVAPPIRFENVVVEGMQLSWTDTEAQMRIQVHDLTLQGDGEVGSGNITFGTTTQIAELTVEAADQTWVHEIALQARGDLVYGLDDSRIQLKDLTGSLNELPMALEAEITPRDDDLLVTARIDAPEATLAGLLSLIPPAYRGSLDAMEASGDVALSLAIDGPLDGESNQYPSVNGAIQVSSGRYRNTALPTAVTDIVVDLTVEHPQGPLEATAVVIDAAAMRVGTSHLRANGRVEDLLGDPSIDLSADGDLQLATLADAFPIEGFEGTGSLALDLAVKGRQSDLMAPNAERIDLRGTMATRELQVVSDLLPLPATVRSADLAFTASRVDVTDLSVVMGRTSFTGTGGFDNLAGYALGGGVLIGDLSIAADHLDLDPFMADPASPAPSAPQPDTPTDGVLQFPPELDVRLEVTSDTVGMGSLQLDDLRADVHLDRGTLRIADSSLGVVGGRATASGTYRAATPDQADLDLDLGLQGVDAADVVSTFTTVQRFVPATLDPTGTFGGRVAVAGQLDRTMALEPASLQSNGRLAVQHLRVQPEIVGSIASKLGRDDLSDIQLGGTDVGFTITDGSLRVEPFDVQLGRLPTRVQGTIDVASQALDLDLGTTVAASAVRATGLLAALGDDAPSEIPVSLRIGGTVLAPTLSVQLDDARQLAKDAVEAKVDDVVERGLDEARQRADAALAEVQRRADAIVAKAERQAARLRTEANAQADELVSDAGSNPIRQRAAKEAGKGIRRAADKAADKLVSTARTQSKRLMDEARATRDRALER